VSVTRAKFEAACWQDFSAWVDSAIVARRPHIDRVATRSQAMRSDKSKRQRNKNQTKISSADDLTKTSKSGHVELDEKDLKRVSGGKGSSQEPDVFKTVKIY
jgi:hypothetical protein